MTKVTYHTFYTDNIPDFVVDMHKEICKKFEIDVKYHVEKFVEPTDNDPFPGYRMHGECMDDAIKTSENEIVGFLDIDCLPLNPYEFKTPEEYVSETRSFCGNAQNISHLKNRHFIYAAASYLIVHKDIWRELGEPSFKYRVFNDDSGDIFQLDTAMELTLRANQMGYDYQLFLPTGYAKPPEKPMKLGPYGWYGIGTHYFNTWHLIRVSEVHHNEEIRRLWLNTCYSILEGESLTPKYKFYPYRLYNYF